MKKNKTFIEITNVDIYNEIKSLHDKIEEFADTNNKQHVGIIQRQDKTNGKVKLSAWASSLAISLSIILLGFLFQHLSQI